MFTISNYCQVIDLKKQIKQIGSIQFDDHTAIRLFFGGRELKDDDFLWIYNITDQSTLTLMYKKPNQ